MDDPTDPRQHRGRLPGNRIQSALRAAGTLSLFRTVARSQVDAEHPDVVVDSQRVAWLAGLAGGMADAAAASVDATHELRRVAGPRRKDLRRAAAQIRSTGLVGEDRATFVADQLLLSAFDGRPVTRSCLSG